MTKYILNSGNAKNFPQKEKRFIKEVLSGLGKKIEILYCFFACPREDWEIKFENYKARFTALAGKGYELSFEMAFPDKFEKQIKKSDIIFIQGGDDYLLQFWLKKFDLPRIWEGKVIATSSAGSDALVDSFWPYDWRQCVDGLGILPIKFIPHFQSKTCDKDDPRGPVDWKKAKKKLSEHNNSALPTYALKEGDFVVFEK